MSAIDCAPGILTLEPNEGCMTNVANIVLYTAELIFGILVLFRFAVEIRRVSLTMRVMLLFYFVLVLCIVLSCIVGLSERDPTTDIRYVLFGVGHCSYNFGITTRTLVFVRVTANKRIRNSTFVFSIAIYVLAAVVSIVLLALFAFTSLYAPPNSVQRDNLHRAGFVVFGAYCLLVAIIILCVSQYVIKLYTGLISEVDASELRRRRVGAAILKQMTASAVIANLIAGGIYLLTGAISGALRNEVAHAIFWLVELAMLPLLRFVRQCAEVRA